jgi:muramoyltetrapeptide carboxypeptidase
MRADVDAVLAIRGGYGSVELLPWLSLTSFERSRTAVIGYSDITSLHIYLNVLGGMTSVHGTMIDRRLSRGPSAYDVASWLASLSANPIGVVEAEALESLQNGEAEGPLFGGTLTQIAASLGTPYAFNPPGGHVLFLDDVDERPYRLQRLLVQLRLGGCLAKASAIIFGEMPGCDEPGAAITARAVVADCLSDFPGPVLYGLPSGHTAVTPPISVPLGVNVRVSAGAHPTVVFDEAAAE